MRIRIDGCGSGQSVVGLGTANDFGDWIIIYSPSCFVISHGFYDRAYTLKNVYMLLPNGSIMYCVMLQTYSIFEES
jgi:hypothetical protein